MATARANFCGVLLLLIASQVTMTVQLGASTRWWNLGVTDCGTRGSNCPNCAQLLNNTFTESQKDKCSDDFAPIQAIARGTQDAIVECQKRYSNQKWNCSTFYSDDLFGKFVVEASTRETAIIQAYFAAGAVKGISAACHDQRIQTCSCEFDGPVESTDEEGNIIYRECGENYAFALEYVLNFIYPNLKTEITTAINKAFFSIELHGNGTISTSIAKTPLRQESTNSQTTIEPESQEPYARVLNDIHNTVVGLKTINRTEQECACHGLSGSCTIQTCYTKVQELSDIGNELSLKYSGAVKVVKEENSTRLISAYSNRDDPSEDDLVYVSESPNFCVRDLARGVVGTEGRLCIPNGDGPDSCQSLCCDNGFYTRSYSQPKEVCRFVWCCYIECVEEGTDEITEHRCNGPRLL